MLVRAASPLTVAQEGINELWRAAVDGGDVSVSERLVHVSHALRRSTLSLERQPAIGLHPATLPAPVDASPVA